MTGSFDRVSTNRVVVAAVVVAAAALLSLQLLEPPVIGLANNGDFERVMGPVGFQYLTQERAKTTSHGSTRNSTMGRPGGTGAD